MTIPATEFKAKCLSRIGGSSPASFGVDFIPRLCLTPLRSLILNVFRSVFSVTSGVKKILLLP